MLGSIELFQRHSIEMSKNKTEKYHGDIKSVLCIMPCCLQVAMVHEMFTADWRALIASCMSLSKA